MGLKTYVPLHNHTYFSELDGYSSPEEYLERCRELGITAFAVSEHGNQYSWVYFDKLREKYPEIRIIYGVEFYECPDIHEQDKDNRYFHLLCLARNENGRKAMNKLVTRSNLEGFYYKPRVDLKSMEPYADDLVVTSACLASKLARESDYDRCLDYVFEYKRIFPHFFLEMQSHSHIEQAMYNQKILQLSRDTDTPYIITTDSHACRKEDLYYQSYHMRTAHDAETASEVYEGCYLQSVEEIHEIMDSQVGYENVERGLQNTFMVADLIDDIRMPFQSPQLPTYPLPEGFRNDIEYLRYLADEGWRERKIDMLNNKKQKTYRERLEYELGVIEEMDFPGYFLIVWDYVHWAKSNGIEVGAGRGSAAGSLVCYLLGISDLDPIKYSLIFERFLNPERVSYPDIDTDFNDRGRVIDYLTDKYGENRVCQIINYSYITPLVAIEDIGKVLGFPYQEMKSLGSKFSYSTFEECVERNRDYLEKHPRYDELIDIAGHISGRLKTVSCHAGGIGIVDTDINDYMGMKLGTKGEHVIEVDKRIIEEIGIIKFDLLGIKTLDMIQECRNDIGLDSWDMNVNNDDFISNPKIYELLQSGRTNGVFQVESAGMKELIIRLHPTNIDDVSVVLALYRPDTMGALNDYIDTKNGVKEVHNVHPDMDEILKNTHNCLLYQEQLMEIVRVFGGTSYGESDLYRKAIAKKQPELVKQESDKLYYEIIDNGYSEEVARSISDSLREKGGYLFNSAHSYSYSVLTLQTAYLKAEYPQYFFKALLNLNKDKVGMLNKYILDARDFNVNVIAPDINRSEVNFSLGENGDILFGLSAISGIGENVAETIIEEREKGKFRSFSDFLERAGLTKAQNIMLIKSGAIPCSSKRQMIINYLKSLYKPTRFTCSAKLPPYRTLLLKWNIDYEKYRTETKKYDYDKDRLYEIYRQKAYDRYLEKENERYRKYCETNDKYLMNEEYWEFEALQIFLMDNPFEKSYEYISKPFDQVETGETCVIPGIIARVHKKKDKNRNSYCFANIYSAFGLVEAIAWHNVYKDYSDLIAKGNAIAMLCRKDAEDRVICQQIKAYDQWLKDVSENRKER